MSAVPKATVALVLERDDHRCVCCGKPNTGQRGWDWSLQHRKKQSAGPDHSPVNVITACGNGVLGCHGWIEHNPLAAQAKGWGISRYADPAEVPVLLHTGRRVFLTADGRYADDPPEVAA